MFHRSSTRNLWLPREQPDLLLILSLIIYFYNRHIYIASDRGATNWIFSLSIDIMYKRACGRDRSLRPLIDQIRLNPFNNNCSVRPSLIKKKRHPRTCVCKAGDTQKLGQDRVTAEHHGRPPRFTLCLASQPSIIYTATVGNNNKPRTYIPGVGRNVCAVADRFRTGERANNQ